MTLLSGAELKQYFKEEQPKIPPLMMAVKAKGGSTTH